MWDLDLAFADVVATSTEPTLGAIRLAWWRDRLDDLDTEGPVDEPRLLAANRHLLPVTNGAMLSMVAEAWMPLLNSFPWDEEVVQGLRARGSLLFAIGSQILGYEGRDAEAAGELWSLADAAFHCSDPQSRDFLIGEARVTIGKVPAKLPAEVRPLTVLATLAANDVLGRGKVARVGAALAHRLTGRFTR